MTLPKTNPFALSFGAHAAVAGILTVLFSQKVPLPKENIPFEVYESPKVVAQENIKALDLKPKMDRPLPKKEEVTSRAVFGISKNTVTDDAPASGGETAVTVKQGNTLATAPDDKKLTDKDAASLPVPADDYLVTKMASLVEAFQIPYPEDARKKAIEGPVVMNILIDDQGVVKDVKLVKGLYPSLDEAALNAIYRFRFKPAYVQTKAVAVNIRYTYRFVLE